MKLLETETKAPSAEACAALVLETVPPIMRAIRAEMRSHRAPGLTVPQFRGLIYLDRHAGASLSDLAGHLGLARPTVSKLVEGLVARGLATREARATDRRAVILGLTDAGRAALGVARAAAEARLAATLAALAPADRAALERALRALGPLFSPERGVPIPPPG